MATVPAAALHAWLAVSQQVGADAPLVPDAGQARRWLTDELSKQPYHSARPSLLQQILDAVGRWLGDVLSGLNGFNANLGVLLITVAGAAVVALALWFAKPRLNPARKQAADVFDTVVPRTAGQYRQLAQTAAGDGDWDRALAERFRAIIRAAEERAVIDPAPGRTAEEAADLLRRAFSGHAAGLLQAARRFDEVLYGGLSATARDYDGVTRLDEALAASHPDLGPEFHQTGVRESATPGTADR